MVVLPEPDTPMRIIIMGGEKWGKWGKCGKWRSVGSVGSLIILITHYQLPITQNSFISTKSV